MAKKGPATIVSGRRVFALAKMTPPLMVEAGFRKPGPTIILDDGTVIYASSDLEMNSAGVLFGESAGNGFHVVPIPDLSKAFRGRMIRSTRLMTPAEIEREGWQHDPPTLVLDMGPVQVWASKDDEGNGPGILHARLADGTHVPLELEGPKEWTPHRP